MKKLGIFLLFILGGCVPNPGNTAFNRTPVVLTKEMQQKNIELERALTAENKRAAGIQTAQDKKDEVARKREEARLIKYYRDHPYEYQQLLLQQRQVEALEQQNRQAAISTILNYSQNQQALQQIQRQKALNYQQQILNSTRQKGINCRTIANPVGGIGGSLDTNCQ